MFMVVSAMLNRSLRWIWIGASVGALIVAITIYDRGENRDIDIVLLLVMTVLSFPASLLCFAIYVGFFMALDVVFGIFVDTSRTEIALTWLGLFVAGYFQWFYLVPHAWQKWRSRERRAAGETAH